MKIISKTLKLLPVLFLVLGLNGCSDDDDNTPTVTTVVDVALANNLTSLAAALTATDLVTTLQGSGPFTVFAPTNSALDTFIANAGLDLDNLTTAQEDLVRNILLNHVIIGENLSSTDLVNEGAGYRSTGATGPDNANLSLYFNTSSGVVINGQSTVNDADNTATNGVLHIVNAVIELPTVVTFAVADPTFDVLQEALTDETPATDFAGILGRTMGGNQDGINPDFTVFAPTNTAFQDLLDSNMMWNSLADIDDATLTNVLLYHVVGGTNVRSSELNQNGTTSPGTLLGASQTIDITLPPAPGTSNIADVTDGAGNDAGIIVVDVQAINGVIHVVNSVLLPAP